MNRNLLLAILFAASNVFGQTKEAATTEALLSEVHQLRLAIESMTGASQRVQIALYSLQLQDAATARASQRLDTVQGKCSAIETERAQFSTSVQQMERMAAPAGPEAKDMADLVAHQKQQLEAKSSQLQSCQAAEAEASTQLKNEQAKLAELQDRITRLDAALAKLGPEGR